jgi:hypothetical protein
VHTIADAHCLGCNERLGWYYIKAANSAQKYKEGEESCFTICYALTLPGKYMLEKEKLVKENAWQLDE